MLFTQAYAMPLCTPSRVQIMTGRYNFRNYIGFGLLDPEETTFAHLLRDAGYRTGIVGKWQLWGNARQREMFGRTGTKPYEAGFDEYCLWQIEEKYGSRFKAPHLEIDGREVEVFEDGYGPEIFTEYAEDFFERHRDRPFFLYYPMVLTHDPFQPVPGEPGYESLEPTDRINDPAYFASNVAYMDAVMGRLVDKLEELDLADQTLFLFTGDNGTDRDVVSQTSWGEVWGNKGFTTSAGTHVPMIAYWPGKIAPGVHNDNLIDFTDFVPTLLDVAGIEPSEGLLLDGLSFYPQMVSEADSVRQWIFCHYASQWGFPDRRYAQTREWKLYEDGAFHNIYTDPLEEHPVETVSLGASERQVYEMLNSVISSMPGAFGPDSTQ
jgi:arylsulfatase A-like enzyme